MELEHYQTVRIAAVDKDGFTVWFENNEIYAEIEGKLRFESVSPMDMPTVGDFVRVRFYNDGDLAIIHDVLPRKTLLKRKSAGAKVDYQLIAANIDAAFIVQSLDENYNLRRLERSLAIVHEAGIEPVVLLTKSDLLQQDEIDRRVDEIIQTQGDLAVIALSNRTGQGVDRVRGLLAPEKAYCLMGSSGVGKTTLLNNLIGSEVYKTAPVREKDSHGRHATTRRQLIPLECGAFLIDTPGMRELAGIDLDAGLEMTFEEIAELALRCRFSDCTHTREPGCAIVQALEQGVLTEERVRNYLKLLKESRFNEMSYNQRRDRDKSFGKMVKNVKKNHWKYK